MYQKFLNGGFGMRASKTAAALLLLQQLCKKKSTFPAIQEFSWAQHCPSRGLRKIWTKLHSTSLRSRVLSGSKSGTTIRELYWLTTYFGVQGYKASMRCRQRRRGASSPGKKRQRPPLRYSSSDNSITVEVK